MLSVHLCPECGDREAQRHPEDAPVGRGGPREPEDRGYRPIPGSLGSVHVALLTRFGPNVSWSADVDALRRLTCQRFQGEEFGGKEFNRARWDKLMEWLAKSLAAKGVVTPEMMKRRIPLAPPTENEKLMIAQGAAYRLPIVRVNAMLAEAIRSEGEVPVVSPACGERMVKMAIRAPGPLEPIPLEEVEPLLERAGSRALLAPHEETPLPVPKIRPDVPEVSLVPPPPPNEVNPPEQAPPEIPPDLRSKPMAIKVAAKHVGFDAEHFSQAMQKGQYRYKRINRQNYIFDISQFPSSARPSMVPSTELTRPAPNSPGQPRTGPKSP